MKKENVLIISIIFLGISIIFSGVYIGTSIKSQNNKVMQVETDKTLIDSEEAANYLGISIKEMDDLILYSSKLFGKGIPYFSIGVKKYFNKESLDQWIIVISENNVQF